MADTNLSKIWQAVLGELEVSLSKANYKTWINGSSLVAVDNGTAIIAAQNIFQKDWIAKKYNDQILAALTKIRPDIVKVEYVIGQSPQSNLESELDPSAAEPSDELATDPSLLARASTTSRSSNTSKNNEGLNYVSLHSNLHSKYNFDNFVVGSSNRLAYAAAKLVADKPGDSYNPLFLYGPAGVGKTHLLFAISSAIAQRAPGAKILYVTSEDFISSFINAVSRGDKFTDKYRRVDVLLVDDMQFIAGKQATQEEFFHTFNALHQTNKQIVLCSDRPPKAIATLEDRLRSRFEWGMVADIQLPDFETRVAIIANKARSKNIDLPDDVAEFIAQAIETNIRELEGGLNKVLAHCEVHGLPITLEIAQEVLGKNSRREAKKPNPKQIIEKTAAHFDLKVIDIMSPKRDKEIVVPRQVAMYIMREEYNISFPIIARSLGKKDHTTVIHGVKKIAALSREDESLGHEIKALKQKLII